MSLNVLCIVQARMNSSRLPGKVLKKIGDKYLIEILLKRLAKSKMVSKIVVAISNSRKDDILESKVKKIGFDVYRGDENDVLNRFYKTSKVYKYNTIIRLTGDCPLIDPNLVDKVVNFYIENKCDYVSNVNPPTFPDGLDVEVFSADVLRQANKKAKTSFEREHVTPWIRGNKELSVLNFENDVNYSNNRWTVDQNEDLILISNILKEFKNNLDFGWREILSLKKKKPEIFKINQTIKRNEGMNMNTGQKLYKHAKTIIPGGTMLLSKRPEMFLPEKWPSYFKKAKGCKVWDLDDIEYIDMSVMGLGTNILGYSNSEVNNVVKDVVELGNMSTLNCREEVDLADKLIQMHPWSDMARFCRSGGEANAMAIRIARAATGKDKIAICGYHGWHDWYLSTNLSNNDGLNTHLLPGLNPLGVPKALADTTIPFNYNDIDQLIEIVDNNPDLGTIKMEVSRNFGPSPGYLKHIRKICDENNIILIFDECTSGFRETFGGLHKKYGIDPDMAMFGKALGNGHAITAVIGTSSIMEFAQETFISSTFWTERIGPTAALKTLDIMERQESWNKITETGFKITNGWKEISNSYGIDIKTTGLPALTSFSIASEYWYELKTYITQEMLKKNLLATNSVYVSLAHDEEVLEIYFEALEQVFKKISDFDNYKDVNKYLDGPICHKGFQRLN